MAPWRRSSGVLVVAGVVAAGIAGTEEPAGTARARSHSFPGELVRVDLVRRSVTVVSAGSEPAAVEAALDEGTRLVGGGRVLRLEDLRAGDRVLVSCVDDVPGRHRARQVKVIPPRAALPAPRAAPSSAASPRP